MNAGSASALFNIMRQLGGAIDGVDAAHRAYVAIGYIVQKQAHIRAFSDTFYALGAALIVAMLASLLLKKPGRLDARGAH